MEEGRGCQSEISLMNLSLFVFGNDCGFPHTETVLISEKPLLIKPEAAVTRCQVSFMQSRYLPGADIVYRYEVDESQALHLL